MSNQHPAVQAKRDIRDFIQSDAVKNQMALVLPKHLTADRMARVALTCLLRTPKLLECRRESLLQALMTCSQFGLEPDGRNAHLIPYGDQVQLILDYKGLVELAMRSGAVANIHADVVCDNDAFEYDRGQIKTHKIDFRKPRGEMYAAYAIVSFKDGTSKCEVMTKDEIDGIRARSRAGKSGPWCTDYNEMAKKTVFRRLSKWISLSPEFRDAVDKDDDRLPEIDVSQPTKPLFEQLPAPPPETKAEPSKAAEPEPPPPPPKTIDEEMLDLCAEANVEESKVIQYLIEAGFVNETMRSFKEIATAEPGKLEKIKRQWTDLLKRIREMEDTLL